MNSQEAHDQFAQVIVAGVDKCIEGMKQFEPWAKSGDYIAEGIRIEFDGGALEVERVTVRITHLEAEEFHVAASVEQAPDSLTGVLYRVAAETADNALSVEGGGQ